MSPLQINPIEPPWYGPVCPVVWEGRRREAPPYPDHLELHIGLGDGRMIRNIGPDKAHADGLVRSPGAIVGKLEVAAGERNLPGCTLLRVIGASTDADVYQRLRGCCTCQY